ncbi:hypothetical protein MNEG_12968, partial [Monoraphidium neglectum]
GGGAWGAVRPAAVCVCPAVGDPFGPAAARGGTGAGERADAQAAASDASDATALAVSPPQEAASTPAAADLKRRLAALEAECAEAQAAADGRVRLRVAAAQAPAAGASGCLSVDCDAAGFEEAAPAEASDGGRGRAWKRLRLLVPAGYPSEPPLAAFGHGTPPPSLAGDPVAALRAAEAWHEFQAAAAERPAADLAGVAALWGGAVERVESGAAAGAAAAAAGGASRGV